jgi:hypothetical protein
MKKLLAILAIVSFGCKKTDYISLSDSDKSTVMFTESGGAPKTFPKLSYIPDGSLTDEYISFEDFTVKTKFDGPMVAPEDITITYAVDAAAVTKFNADGAAGNPSYKPFAILPTSNFSLAVTSDVIKKGEVYAPKVTNNILVHPNLIDPAKNYVIPISVKSSAYPSSVGTGTIFFTIIGNPLAGAYSVTGYFYHPSAPRAFTRTGASGALSPVSENSLVTELGDLGGSGYYAVLTVPDPYATTIQPVTISVYPGSISPVYQWNTALPAASPGYTAAWAGSALTNNTYNPATKTFYLRYGYASSGVFRVTEEIIVKQ